MSSAKSLPVRSASPADRARTRPRPWLLLVLLAACAQRCPNARTGLPADLLSNADALDVRGNLRQSPRALSFGPYATRKAWVNAPQRNEQEPSFMNGWVSHAEQKQTAGFELAHEAGALFKGHCTRESRETVDRDRSLVFGKNGMEWQERVVQAEFSSIFRCVLTSPEGEQLRLGLRDGRRGKVEGKTSEQELAALARPSTKEAPGVDLAATYVIEDGTASLGAVALTAEPKVMLRKGLPTAQRDRLAAIATALLLLRDMRP